MVVRYGLSLCWYLAFLSVFDSLLQLALFCVNESVYTWGFFFGGGGCHVFFMLVFYGAVIIG